MTVTIIVHNGLPHLPALWSPQRLFEGKKNGLYKGNMRNETAQVQFSPDLLSRTQAHQEKRGDARDIILPPGSSQIQ